MTIGKYLEHKGRQSAVGSLACIAVIVLMCVVPRAARPYVAYLVAAPFALLYAIFVASIRCPKCRGSLGADVTQAAYPFTDNTPDRCKFCGAPFDTEMPIEPTL